MKEQCRTADQITQSVQLCGSRINDKVIMMMVGMEGSAFSKAQVGSKYGVERRYYQLTASHAFWNGRSALNHRWPVTITTVCTVTATVRYLS